MKRIIQSFKKWLNFNCPEFETLDGWDIWETKYKKEAPIRYFLTHTLPSPLSTLRYKIDNAKSWCRYRIVRYHVLHTGLKPYYYDKDTLLLHASFNLLKDFVEVEKAWLKYIRSDETPTSGVSRDLLFAKKFHIPYYEQIFFRSPKLGLKYLAWEATLDSPDIPVQERNVEQATTAREIIELYNWWTIIRPCRSEMEYPVPAVTDNNTLMYPFSDSYKAEHPVDFELREYVTDYNFNLEKQWNDEDDYMLNRLISIRRSLWT